MPGGHPGDAVIAELADRMDRDFGIAHTTLQVETGSGAQPCALAPDHVV
jgi:cobalt-zinc-cadmium efflux system protein